MGEGVTFSPEVNVPDSIFVRKKRGKMGRVKEEETGK
jgi:hypothetical protein